MLQLKLDQVGKRFNTQWVYRGLSLELVSGQSLAILGSNGSGKSTLLQCISGFAPFSEGKASFTLNNKVVAEESWYQLVAIASPFMELPEELSLKELLTFHQAFKPLTKQWQAKDFAAYIGIPYSADKRINQYSSGMRQRVKLGLTLQSLAPLVLLDEPTANLDTSGIAWYQAEMAKPRPQQLVLVASNDLAEYAFCRQTLAISDYKPTQA